MMIAVTEETARLCLVLLQKANSDDSAGKRMILNAQVELETQLAPIPEPVMNGVAP